MRFINANFFFKEFIESKKFSKLKSVNHILDSTISFSKNTELHRIIKFLRKFDADDSFIINANVTMVNKKSEYLLNQQYTLNIGEVLNYYDLWCRDIKIKNILEETDHS
jgi:hypothetical protein